MLLLAITGILFIGTISIMKKYYFSHPSFIFANIVYGLAFKRNYLDSYICFTMGKTGSPYCNNDSFPVNIADQKIIIKNRQTQISMAGYGFLVISRTKSHQALLPQIFSAQMPRAEFHLPA